MNILSSLFMNIRDYLIIIPIALVSLTIHECAHGFVAYKLGDPTAKMSGRLTLNPIKHIDPVGLIMMIILRIGYAKPVPVNPMYFKNPKKGMFLTALAGPVSNLVLATLCVLLTQVFSIIANSTNGFLAEIFFMASILNLGYAVFNLIPVYPLDGSRILGYFMPDSFNNFFIKYGQYVQIAFVLLVVLTDVVSDVVFAVQIFLFRAIATMWSYPLSAILSLF